MFYQIDKATREGGTPKQVGLQSAKRQTTKTVSFNCNVEATVAELDGQREHKSWCADLMSQWLLS